MHIRLHFLVTWPSREVLEHNVPSFIKQLYPSYRCIIDCSEVFIETPANFDARAKVYSNYKHHSTIKFLIGITPCGAISYVSHAWGGRVSDKNLCSRVTSFSILNQETPYWQIVDSTFMMILAFMEEH